MKLFMVKRTDEPGWDEYDGIVVRAESEARAIEMATGYDEHGIGYTGLAPHNIEVTEIPIGGDEAVILSSFNAG
jgi:hypothetical protein